MRVRGIRASGAARVGGVLLALAALLSSSCVTGRKAEFYVFEARGIGLPVQAGPRQAEARPVNLLSTSWSWSPEHRFPGSLPGSERSMRITDDSSMSLGAQLERLAIGAKGLGFESVEFSARVVLGPFLALSELFLRMEGGAVAAAGAAAGKP